MFIFAKSRNLRYQRAFTLVELLVVIAIIGVLVSLLLPAVQAAREAARRAQCQNNLRQIGLAALNYENTRNELPPGGVVYGTTDGNRTRTGTGWMIEIMPYLEQRAIYDQFDFSGNRNFGHNAHRTALQTTLASLVCPSDTFADALVAPEGMKDVDVKEYAPTTYKGVSGVLDEEITGGFVYWDRVLNDLNRKSEFDYLRGPLSAVSYSTWLKPVKIAQITDGTSQTLLAGEYHTLTSAEFRKSVWGSSWRYHNKAHVVRGSLYRVPDIDYCRDPVADGGGGGIVWKCIRTFASLHAGGVINFAACDGSVTAINEDTDDEIYLNYGSIAGGLSHPGRVEADTGGSNNSPQR